MSINYEQVHKTLNTLKKILVIHRYYKVRGGEDVFLDETFIPVLKNSGLEYEIMTFSPLSFKSVEGFLEILFMTLGFETLRPSYRKIKCVLKTGNFSQVVLNNFIPTLSLAIPALCQKGSVRISAWIHNARIICANGLCFNGKIDCLKCHTEGSRWAFTYNCHGNRLQSCLYAFIYRFHRVEKILAKSEVKFLCNSVYSSGFVKTLKSKFGGDEISFEVIPFAPAVGTHTAAASTGAIAQAVENHIVKFGRKFLLYVGRLSFEKGVDRFIAMAVKQPNKAFVVCGEGPLLTEMKKAATPNVVFWNGRRDEIQALYFAAEALVVPSRVKETSSLVISESQASGVPVIYPAGGGAEETMRRLSRNGIKIEDYHGQELPRSQADSQEITEMRKIFTQTVEKILSL